MENENEENHHLSCGAEERSNGGREMENENKENERERIRAALRNAFGDSDSDEDSHSNANKNGSENSGFQVGMQEKQKVWEQVKEINGLWLCRNFLSSQQQDELLNCIKQERWFEEPSKNQAMCFGNLPEWSLKVCELVKYAICSYDVVCTIGNSTSCSHEDKKCSPLSPDLLWREPLFDQMIVNAYQPGEGIHAHVDLLRFEDGIAIISLESACIMHFTHQKAAQRLCVESKSKANPKIEPESTPALKIPVLLMPGDIVLMSGEARYDWLHEINRKAGHQNYNGEEIIQRRRISITLRHLCQTK